MQRRKLLCWRYVDMTCRGHGKIWRCFEAFLNSILFRQRAIIVSISSTPAPSSLVPVHGLSIVWSYSPGFCIPMNFQNSFLTVQTIIALCERKDKMESRTRLGVRLIQFVFRYLI